ncbi:GyrI-like domain-containing protein [Streptomyces sp. NPDC015220]|uniref:AraC family transcriptional regulator n=1 Tax=Streptomyces sp. NPDC015220 TaxID=3364947 RepID=UPI0036FD9B4F
MAADGHVAAVDVVEPKDSEAGLEGDRTTAGEPRPEAAELPAGDYSKPAGREFYTLLPLSPRQPKRGGNMFTVEEIPESRIAYLRRTGPYGEANGIQMERLKSWAAANGLLRADSAVLGIARDDPARTAPRDCRYDTCLVLPDDAEVRHPDVLETRLAGGRHAVLTTAHTPEGLAHAWAGLFDGLAAQDLTFDTTRPVLERYRPRLLAQHLCEICIPIT